MPKDIHLETERLILRRITMEDAEDLRALDADPEVRRRVDMPEAPSLAEVVGRILPRMLSFEEPGLGFFAAVERATGDFLGWFHFRRSEAWPDAVELGYRLKRAAWGKGLATEGARALVRKGFTEQGVRRVVASALAANTASTRVMEKCGLTLARRFDYKGQPAVWYALDREDWLRQQDSHTGATSGSGPSASRPGDAQSG